ncbi:MAG: hypothetical protein Q9219_004510 [cf. Caloplaca sp. 3 TL-2023]
MSGTQQGMKDSRPPLPSPLGYFIKTYLLLALDIICFMFLPQKDLFLKFGWYWLYRLATGERLSPQVVHEWQWGRETTMEIYSARVRSPTEYHVDDIWLARRALIPLALLVFGFLELGKACLAIKDWLFPTEGKDSAIPENILSATDQSRGDGSTERITADPKVNPSQTSSNGTSPTRSTTQGHSPTVGDSSANRRENLQSLLVACRRHQVELQESRQGLREQILRDVFPSDISRANWPEIHRLLTEYRRINGEVSQLDDDLESIETQAVDEISWLDRNQ